LVKWHLKIITDELAAERTPLRRLIEADIRLVCMMLGSIAVGSLKMGMDSGTWF
jgi:hypothetical protein